MHKNIKWANKELPGLSHEDLVKLNSAKLGQIEGGKITGPALGKKNVESGLLDRILPAAREASKEWYKNNVEKAKQQGSIKGKLAAKTNKENGNLDRLADLKIRQTRKKWALMLLELGLDEFLSCHIEESSITYKQWNNIKSRSNLVIKTDKKGKIESKRSISFYYKLNLEAINEAINDNLNFF